MPAANQHRLGLTLSCIAGFAALMCCGGDFAAAKNANVDCTRAPHQIGDLLGVYRSPPRGDLVQAMNVDTLRIASRTSHATVGWVFIDQFADRWIVEKVPGMVHFNAETQQMRDVLRRAGGTSTVSLPGSVTLADDMALERCDRVSSP